MRATLHLVNREFEALADDFVTLGMLPKTEVGAGLLVCLPLCLLVCLPGRGLSVSRWACCPRQQ